MTNPAWTTENERIAGFYADLLAKYGHDPRSLDWGSRGSQELRFKVLAGIGSLSGCSVLDVGCGLADLLEYLQRSGISVDYTGYDLSLAVIERARERFPQTRLEVHDILADTYLGPQFDYVLASGIFYKRQVDPMDYLQAMVRQMFDLCQTGVAFNTLSTRAPQHEQGEFRAEPSKVLTICQAITPLVVLRHDYLSHDFTVYLYREQG